MPSFHSSLPTRCPPVEATPASGTIFRGIPAPPVSGTDFLSHAELKRKNCDPQICEHWGLSVWTTMAEAQHAQRIFRHMRTWHVASGKVTASDGVMMSTPTNSQSGHHTFWKYFGLDITSRFQIVLRPLASI